MKIISPKILAVSALVAGSGLLAGIGIAHADNSASGQNSMSDLVQKISQKFNLNQNDVQQVFDEHRDVMHSQREAEMQVRLKEKLAQLVKDRKLTQDQADKLSAKMQEMHDKREAQKNSGSKLTQDQMRQQIDQQKAETDQWLKDNNIPSEIMQSLRIGRGDHGMRGVRMHKNFDVQDRMMSGQDSQNQ